MGKHIELFIDRFRRDYNGGCELISPAYLSDMLSSREHLAREYERAIRLDMSLAGIKKAS